MTSHHEKEPGRRDFLRMVALGAASFATGRIHGSTYAEQGNAQMPTKTDGRSSLNKVELLFLGTGAADWPRQYPPAEQELARGEVRGMCSMLVNRHILIDCGPTVLDVMKRYDVNSADITDLLMTHTHADHFHVDSIRSIAEARDKELGALRIWAHPEVLKMLPESDWIEQRPVVIGETFQVQGLDVTGLEANHHVEGSKETCMIYLLKGESVSALYATDTSWLPRSTWLHLHGKSLDALIWDTTIGEQKGDPRIFVHNDLAMIRHMNHALKNRKIITPETQIILTHLARTLHPGHDELEEKLLPEGLIPAYDGMSVILE